MGPLPLQGVARMYYPQNKSESSLMEVCACARMCVYVLCVFVCLCVCARACACVCVVCVCTCCVCVYMCACADVCMQHKLTCIQSTFTSRHHTAQKQMNLSILLSTSSDLPLFPQADRPDIGGSRLQTETGSG